MSAPCLSNILGAAGCPFKTPGTGQYPALIKVGMKRLVCHCSANVEAEVGDNALYDVLMAVIDRPQENGYLDDPEWFVFYGLFH